MKRTHSIATVAACVAALGVLTAAPTRAQDLEPRAYSNTPVGLNFLVAGYSYTDGSVSADPSVALEDAEIEIHNSFLAYARAVELLGRSAKVDVVLPYSWLSGSATYEGEPRERETDGLGDPRLRFSLNVFGAPALKLEEFASYEQDVIVGLSLQVTAPLGQYDRDKLVNIGTNRWSVKPEIGISKRWGRFTLEIANGVALYTDNEKFLGDRELERQPLHSLQVHAIYTIWHNVWAALDFTYYGGGKTRIDGESAGERQENTRVGGTLALPLGHSYSMKIYGSAGTSARLGGDFDTVGIAWQYRWGGGL